MEELEHYPQELEGYMNGKDEFIRTMEKKGLE